MYVRTFDAALWDREYHVEDNMMRTILHIISAGLLATLPTAAFAISITWGFEGYTAGPGLPGGECDPVICESILYDTPFFGQLTFDSNATDLNSSPEGGTYISSGSPYGIDMTIGDFSYRTDVVEFYASPEPYTSLPQYNIAANQVDTSFSRILIGNCYGPFSGVITTDAQRTDPPPLEDQVGCPDPSFIRIVDGADIALDVTRYFRIPEPTALWLMGIGLIGLALLRRWAA